LASCCGRLTKRNSVLEEFSVKRLAVIQEDIFWRVLELSDAGVKNRWIEREEQFSRQHKGGISTKVTKQEY